MQKGTLALFSRMSKQSGQILQVTVLNLHPRLARYQINKKAFIFSILRKAQPNILSILELHPEILEKGFKII